MRGGCHEMRAPDVPARHRPRLAPARLVRQAALLLPRLPRHIRNRSASLQGDAVVRAEPVRSVVRAGKRIIRSETGTRANRGHDMIAGSGSMRGNEAAPIDWGKPTGAY